MWRYSYLISWLFFGLIIYVIFRAIFGRKSKYYKWLQKQLPLWEQGNIINPEQSDRIRGLYKLKKIDPAKKMDMVKIFSIIGAIFVGVGVMSFVASNWQRMPNYLKTIKLLGTTSFTLILGYYLSYEKEAYRKTGKALVLLSSIFWGASIALICQIYQVPSSGNWLIMLIWAFPILPLAIVFENEYVYILSSVLFVAWNYLYSTANSVPNYFYPVMVFLLLIPMGKMSIIGQRINVLALITAGIYAAIWKYEWVSLIIGVGFLIYYILKKDEKFYFYGASLSFIAWLFTFSVIHLKHPNFYFLIPLSVLLYMTYRNKVKENILFCILSFVVWIHLVLKAFNAMLEYRIDGMFNLFMFTLFIGAFLYLVGVISLKKEYIFHESYKKMGFLIAAMTVYFLSFKNIYPHQNVNMLYVSASVGLMIITLIGIGFGFVARYFNSRTDYKEIGTLVAILLAGVFLLISPKAAYLNALVMNILLIGLGIVCLLMGVDWKKPSIFNSGIAILALFIITRYIDVAWKLKEKSLFFVVGGLLMLGGGVVLEKQRRKIVERMKI
ncbi:MAG: DUF2157 domain-containing protein [bacterium]